EEIGRRELRRDRVVGIDDVAGPVDRDGARDVRRAILVEGATIGRLLDPRFEGPGRDVPPDVDHAQVEIVQVLLEPGGRDERVTVINGEGGNWAEYAVIPARQARPVAADIPDEQVASFFVNPATVLAMVRHVLRVPRGEWLLQSAAGSALGRMIIKLGRHDGF